MTINNNNIFGAFTLNEARGSRLTGDWLNKEFVANYGWFGGGQSPSSVATVDRIDFSNDLSTASPRGPLSQARYSSGATGNSNYGWFGGGSTTPTTSVSTVDRIDFSNDSATASSRGPLSQRRRYFAATGNSNFGWFGGGDPGPLSIVDRIDFSNDNATASPRGPLSSGRYSLAATGNSNYGWFGGGNNPQVATVDRIDFSNDSVAASVRGPLRSARQLLAATSNSNYGWFGGGFVTANVATVDRIDFSNDSATASIRGSLTSPARQASSATGNSNYGWFGGGFPVVETVERIDFSNDSVTASPRGPLSSARYSLAATSGVLNIRRQKAGNYGWFGGGRVPAVTATVDRIDFSNDSATASPRGTLGVARTYLAATGNSNYGWFGGGSSSVPLTGITATVDRIDFSNDLATAPSRGPLSAARGYLAATGNSNYGWFGGGALPGSPSAFAVSTVDRIDFANDSATASVRGPLSVIKIALTATGNSNYGWFGGGIDIRAPAIYATVDRIDFSNDSASASPRGPLSQQRSRLVATGNSNYGWFGGGGTTIAGGVVATVDRIDFSNDSSTALVRGPLSSARDRLAATGNSNYGWFGGGSPTTSTVDRINFANDSSTASPRDPLSAARGYLAATSNTSR